MLRPLLSLERLSLDEKEAKVCYQYGKEPREVEAMDYLEFIARVTSHIPDKGQVTMRYYGLYARTSREVKRASLGPFALRMVEDLRTIPSKGWAEMIRKSMWTGSDDKYNYAVPPPSTARTAPVT